MKAIFQPLNVWMLGLIAAAGLFAAYWLVPIGLVFWLVMVTATARELSSQRA